MGACYDRLALVPGKTLLTPTAITTEALRCMYGYATLQPSHVVRIGLA